MQNGSPLRKRCWRKRFLPCRTRYRVLQQLWKSDFGNLATALVLHLFRRYCNAFESYFVLVFGKEIIEVTA